MFHQPERRNFSLESVLTISLYTDSQLLQLLLKASQDKRFVCEEAEKALDAMARLTPPLPLLKKLQSYVNHKNLRVRAKAAVAIAKCISVTVIITSFCNQERTSVKISKFLIYLFLSGY